MNVWLRYILCMHTCTSAHAFTQWLHVDPPCMSCTCIHTGAVGPHVRPRQLVTTKPNVYSWPFFFFFFFFLQRQINVTLPSKTLRNGTLYAYVYLGPKGRHPQQHSQYVAASSAPLTRYSVPEMTAFNLLSGENHVSFEQGRARLILLSERFGPRTM